MLRSFISALILLVVWSALALGQEQKPAQNQSDDVVLIETTLMQAGVTVLDKQGRFVDNLKAEQFEVRVDGKPQTISSFERVAAGSSEERAKLETARGAKASPASAKYSSALPDQGRVALFFLDDLHMTPESIVRARKVIQHFIDKEMGQNDVAAVASASGQLGFLQQITQNKTVLRTALSRLKPRQVTAGDGQIPVMTEYLAKAIAVEGSRDVLETYVQALVRDGIRRTIAEKLVLERARSIHQIATETTKNTLRSLNSMIRAVSPLPGRKLIFFLSDGFLLSLSDTDTGDMLYNIIDSAVRSGFVLYTMDSRGLATDLWLDAESPLPADSSATALRATRGEMTASQEALYLLAEQTGGRALLNTNALTGALSKTLNETAAYYIVAWRPSENDQKGGKFHRLEVTVKDRPDVVVLVQRGFLERASMATATRSDGKKATKPGEELNAALSAALPIRELPAELSLSYLSSQKEGAIMTALLSVPLNALGLAQADDLALEVQGYVVNLEGKIGSRFSERLSAKAAAQASSPSQATRQHILYRHQVKLDPGIYQVRAAVRDANGKRVGSAAEWIEIPDLKSGQLMLGSLVIGERPAETSAPLSAENFVSERNADHRFTRDSNLRFMAFIYNAARGAQSAPPELEMQIQVLREDKPVFTDDWRKVDLAGQDLARIAYGGELGLDTMSPGRYVLQLTVNDRVAKIKTSQRASFTIE